MRDALNSALLVGAGGFLGSLLRYGVAVAARHRWPDAIFPVGTLGVNVIGCLVIGLVAGLAEARDVPLGVWLFLAVGTLGGFTTFSSFGLETVQLVREGQAPLAALNVAITTLTTVASVALGFGAGRWIGSLTNM